MKSNIIWSQLGLMLQGLEKGILKHHRDTAIISSQLQGKILSSANWHLGKDPKRDLKL